MTSDEFAEAASRYVADPALASLIRERVAGPGREQYEQDEDTQRVEVVEVDGLVTDVREEIADAIVYAAALHMRGGEGAMLVVGYLSRAWAALGDIRVPEG